MPRSNPILTNFTSGEVSPLMQGRVDVSKYANGAKRLRNFLVKTQGGLYRRSGTRYVNAVKTSANLTIITDFQFSTLQAYVLEFGDLYVRFYKDGVRIESPPGTPVEVATPYPTAALTSLCFIQSADTLYIMHPSYQTRKLTRTSHTTWTLSKYNPDDGPYMDVDTSGAYLTLSSVVDAATAACPSAPFVVGDVNKYIEFREDGQWKLAKITAYVSSSIVTVAVQPSWEQRIPEIFLSYGGGNIGSPDYTGVFNPQDVGKFYRTAANTWYIATSYVADDALAGTLVTQKALTYPADNVTVSGRTITATLTASSAKFVSTDVDRKFRLAFQENWIWGYITAYSSTTSVTVRLDSLPPHDKYNDTTYMDNGRSFKWRLGAWSDTTGWPSAGAFHEQRVIFGGTTTQPQTVWMSESSDYESMSPTDSTSKVLDSNAVTYTIASNQVNAIVWMQPGPVLLIGTTQAEWQVKASTINEPITPTNITIIPQTSFGSKNTTRAKKVGSAVLFLEKSGKKIREMTYNFNIEAFEAKDLNVISEHILREAGKGTSIAYQQTPNSIMWVVTTVGRLLGMTYERDQDVVAWHPHYIGGSGIVESICVVPGADGSDDVLYMVVKRTINSTTKRYIEYLEADFFLDDEDVLDGDEGKDGMFFVDCGLTYDGSPATSISGLSHLEGETVAIIADGAVLPSQIVASGAITLSSAASVVHVGYSYTSRVSILPLEGGSQFGTAQGKIKRIDTMSLRLLHSLGFKHGVDHNNLTSESFRNTADNMDESPPLFTGDKRFSTESTYDLQTPYVLQQDQPYPLNILAVMPELKVNDR